MKSLKTKASRFFRDSPSRDERAAINDHTGPEADFDAGISEGLDKKRQQSSVVIGGLEKLTSTAPRYFWKKEDKPLPPLPSEAHTAAVIENAGSTQLELIKTVSAEKPLPTPPSLKLTASLETPSVFDSVVESKRKSSSRKLMARPSLATLKSKSSVIFRSGPSKRHSPPPPPLPQIPIDTSPPRPRRSTIEPPDSSRSRRSSRRSKTSDKLVISRPVLTPQASDFEPTTFARITFTHPEGPPPQRPARPPSLDEETLALIREDGTRMVLPSTTRSSISTAPDSRSSASRRLGLPSGRTTLDSALTSQYSCKSLPSPPKRRMRGSRRIAEYLRGIVHHKRHASDPTGEPGAPMELFRSAKDGEDWTLEKRASGAASGKGMLFKDGSGGWHFVPDL